MAKYKSLASRLSNKILTITANIFVVAILAVTAVTIVAISKEARSNASRALDNTILEIEKALTRVEGATSTMSTIAKEAIGDGQALTYIAKQLLDSSDEVVGCAIGAEPGEYGVGQLYACYDNSQAGNASSSSGGNISNYVSANWYIIPKTLKKPYWTEPFYDSAGSRTIITSYCVPMYDAEGAFLGIIRSDVTLDWLADVLEKFKPYETAVTLLIGRTGTFIAHRDKEKVLNETVFTNFVESDNQVAIAACKKLINGERGIITLPIEGKMVHCVYSPISNGWSAVNLTSFQTLYGSAMHIILILVLIALVGLIILYFLSKKKVARLTMPITEITYSALNMSKGFFNTHIPDVDNDDEIKYLHDALGYLQKSIKSYIHELRSTSAANERIESELNIANEVQMSILPKNFPARDVCDLYATVTPAKEVGGDLYDFSIIDRTLYFSIGDVSGKGVPAALFMAITNSFLRMLKGMNLGLGDAMSKLNDSFNDGNEYGMFVTMFIAEMNLDTGEVKYCNAGHNPIIIISPDGTARYHKAKTNIAAGLFPGFAYEDESMTLEKGSRLLLYTDGITEAENRAKELYGEDRLLECVSSIDPKTDSKTFVELVEQSVSAFTEGNPQSDDITLVSIIV